MKTNALYLLFNLTLLFFIINCGEKKQNLTTAIKQNTFQQANIEAKNEVYKIDSILFDNIEKMDEVINNTNNKDEIRIAYFNAKNSDTIVKALHIKKLKIFPGLNAIEFFQFNFTDKALKEIGNLKKINTLTIQDSNFNEHSLFLLKKLKKLENLSLYDTKITNKGLSYLKYFNLLKKLEFGDMQIIWNYPLESPLNNEGLIPLRNVKNLESLRIFASAINNQGLKYLKNLKKLKHLELVLTEIDGRNLDGLSPLVNLVKLNFAEKFYYNDVDMSPIRSLINLKELRLGCHFPSDASKPYNNKLLEPLSYLKKLEHLEVHDLFVTDKMLSPLKELKNLMTVMFNGTQVSEKGVAEIKSALPFATLN